MRWFNFSCVLLSNICLWTTANSSELKQCSSFVSNHRHSVIHNCILALEIRKPLFIINIIIINDFTTCGRLIPQIHMSNRYPKIV